jgi:hypothetical protein
VGGGGWGSLIMGISLVREGGEGGEVGDGERKEEEEGKGGRGGCVVYPMDVTFGSSL